MSLITRSEALLATTVEDPRLFGWPLTLTDPAGTVSNGLHASGSDISGLIDPDTGQLVNGRSVHFTLRISTLVGQGLQVPEGEVSSGVKPWLVQVADTNGTLRTFKVRRADPDRTLGVVSCYLENYST